MPSPRVQARTGLEDAPRLRRLSARVVPALGAGVVLASIDVVRAGTAGAGVRASFLVVVAVLFASVIAALLLVGLQASDTLLRRLVPRLPPALWRGLAAAAAAWPLARELFAGAGVRRAGWGLTGQAAMVVSAALLTPLVIHAGAAVVHRSRRSLALALLAFVIAALLVDQGVHPRGYPSLHIVLVALACVGFVGVWQLLIPPRPWHAELGALTLGGSSLALVLLTTLLPCDVPTRVFLASERPIAARLLAGLGTLVDFDRDGGTGLAGLGDCDDFDPQRFVGARDYPGNGRDEDCDGRDAGPPRRRMDYGGDARTARRIGEAARGRTTVVLVVDALRADRVGRPDLPNLARLAGESLAFRNAYAPASSTGRSVPAMVTGVSLPEPSVPSVMHRLRARGQRSALVTVGVVAETIEGVMPSPGSIAYPFRRAFDQVDLVEVTRDAAHHWGGGVSRATDDTVTDHAFALLESTPTPDLLWVHYFDLHQWVVRSDLEVGGTARYDAILRDTDRQIGRWLARAEDVNLVLVADHGEGLGDEDITTHTGYLTPSLVRVPWLVRIPGVAPTHIDAPVTTLDLASMVLTLSGAAPSTAADAGVLGLVGATHAPRASFAAYETHQIAYVEGRHRAVFDLETGARWLFDILRDPGERHSLVAADPERARVMIEAALQLRGAADSDTGSESER